MPSITILLTILIVSSSIPSDDKIVGLPGYPSSFSQRVFAGYLQTSSSLRKLHYVFMESPAGVNNKDPVTLWMNGGPGCTSKLGLLQQISPYFLPVNTPYKQGSNLVKNQYSWLRLSNLLFIDSPAGVGFSINSDSNYKHNDQNTARDNIDVLVKFFAEKFQQYSKNDFYIAGESYAGKYIPDLAVQIDNHNAMYPKDIINLKGILIGNGVINFQDGSLDKSRVQFMISHNLIDPKLVPVWERSCLLDSDSAGCAFFNKRFDDLVGDLDPYNIYGPCFSKRPSQKSFLLKAMKKFNYRGISAKASQQPPFSLYGVDCSNDEGVEDYFRHNYKIFNSEQQSFVVCNDKIFQDYEMTPSGSLDQMARLLAVKKIKVYLYNGDWDDVVPFTDTLKNLELLNLKQEAPSEPWIINDQHVGFRRNFTSGLKFYTIKGAGHEAPQYQRQAAFDMFQTFLKA